MHNRDRNVQRKVAIYGRVSTEHEAQLSAFENQQEWYEHEARRFENWTIVDRYYDEGITGTSAEKRPAFMRMMRDAEAGKFDLIMTREVCRFARNTVDALQYTRALRDIGVEIYFVQDNIWSMDGDGELRLTFSHPLHRKRAGRFLNACLPVSKLAGKRVFCMEAAISLDMTV